MRVTGIPASLAALLAVSLSQAQYLINELSFGHTGRISPPHSSGQVPHFVVDGSPQKPDILSNKIILTPISPGNQRSSVWSEKPLTYQQWTADVDFRASGPERGGGNLNLWLVRGGSEDVGSSSIYTVGKFDGLALVVDMHGGSGGMVRGFLNDGSSDYSQHHNVDELAFGHCLYSYRNLGRPSQIKLRQTADAFRVEIDGNLCFESDKFSLPPGYKFGITAATPDSPDSFELFKFAVVHSDETQPDSQYISRQQYVSRQQRPNGGAQSGSAGYDGQDFEGDFEPMPDEDADIFQTSKTQFVDLHNRLQGMNHFISAVMRTVSKHHQMDEQRHAELKDIAADLKNEFAKLDQVSELQRRIKDLEKEVRGMRNDLGKKIQANERSFKGYLSDHHDTLSQTVMNSVPGHGRLIFIFVGTQVLLVVLYVLYKRRRAQSPRKYL